MILFLSLGLKISMILFIVITNYHMTWFSVTHLSQVTVTWSCDTNHYKNFGTRQCYVICFTYVNLIVNAYSLR